MFRLDTEQKVCEIGGIKFGGQPGEYPTVIVPSIFQKGDKVFEGGRKEGFNTERASELVKMCDKLCTETGIPYMADIVATKGDQSAWIDECCKRGATGCVIVLIDSLVLSLAVMSRKPCTDLAAGREPHRSNRVWIQPPIFGT